MKNVSKIIIFCFVSCMGLFTISAQTTSKIELIKKTVVGGEGSWDFLSVDPKSRLLYVSHSTKVEVLNADTHAKIGEIGDIKGVHGIMEVPSLNKAYTTNGKTNNVTVFDTKTLKKLGEIPTGEKPDAILFDAFSGHLFVFNNAGGNVTVIDPKSDKVLKTIEIGGALEIGVSDEKGLIYVNVEDKNEIVVFSSKDFGIKNRFKLAPGEEPTGLAIDIQNNRLFSGCHNELLIVIDAATGNVISKLPIGKGVDGVVFIKKEKLIISSNGEGSLTVIKENTANDFKVIETIQTMRGAKTITLDSKTNHIFLSAAQYGETPPVTTENQKPRAPIIPNTFTIMEYGIK